MRKVILFASIIILLSSCTTYYYVVRHADRLNSSNDSPLSTAGFQRAQDLKDSLINVGIDSIFVSTFIRTQQTATPLADALGKTMRIYRPDTTNGLITSLKRIQGKEMLVVGHSDNVPDIVQGLSGQTVAAIAGNDFDNLYIIRIRKGFRTKRTLWHKTYGAPSP